MQTNQNNAVFETQEKTVVDPIDPNAFGEIQKQMLAEKQKELDELNHSVSNIEFSMNSLQKQLDVKRHQLSLRQAEFDKIKNTTLDALLKKKD